MYIAGRGSDIAFIIDESAPIEEVARDLCAQLSGRGALFSEGGVSVNTGRRSLSAKEKAAIRRVFMENSGLTVSRFVSAVGDHVLESDEYSERPVRRKPASRWSDGTEGQNLDLAGLPRGSQRNRSQAMFIRSTVRSGESLHHYGDIVVLGDVNPGSEIRAGGDIVVMGTLKGLAHAGSAADNKAAIIALEISSPRIRIGDCEATLGGKAHNHRRKDKSGRVAGVGQLSIAYTQLGGIYNSPFAGCFTRYTKGVPYDG